MVPFIRRIEEILAVKKQKEALNPPDSLQQARYLLEPIVAAAMSQYGNYMRPTDFWLTLQSNKERLRDLIGIKQQTSLPDWQLAKISQKIYEDMDGGRQVAQEARHQGQIRQLTLKSPQYRNLTYYYCQLPGANEAMVLVDGKLIVGRVGIYARRNQAIGVVEEYKRVPEQEKNILAQEFNEAVDLFIRHGGAETFVQKEFLDRNDNKTAAYFYLMPRRD